MNDVKLVVSIDPGMANFGVAGISVIGDQVKLEYEQTFDIRGSHNELNVDRLKTILILVEYEVIKMEQRHRTPHLSTLWVVEYQPPLDTRNNPGLVRQNTFIEAFVQCWCIKEHYLYRKVAPAAVKNFFGFPKSSTNQYHLNKQVSKEKVRNLLGGRRVNDHIADCVLNGLYGLIHSH